MPAVCAGAAGTAGLVLLDSPVVVVAGMALFGAGYGVIQNVTLTIMFDRVPRAEFGRASALWNIAFDGGMGIGAVGFGVLIGWTGYAAGFAVTAGLLLAAVVPAWYDTAAARRRAAGGPGREVRKARGTGRVRDGVQEARETQE